MKRVAPLNLAVIIAVCTAVLCAIALAVWYWHGTTITIDGNGGPGTAVSTKTLTGLACEHADRRPIAVMLGSDPEARPLSGLAEADVVIEMPVTPNGITRLMALYQCGSPSEIGSIRSSRGDFIPLAEGFDVIYAHWGGERDALAQLNAHVLDNIDALTYEGTTFYRKTTVARPYNGFTTIPLLTERAQSLGYQATSSFQAWPHRTAAPERSLGSLASVIDIPYPALMAVRFTYDTDTNTYLRWRNGTAETDRTTGQQVRVSNVIVMSTETKLLYDQYISVRTVGSGQATVYRDGIALHGTWKKSDAGARLMFVDDTGTEIPLAPGNTWISVLGD